MAAKKRRKPPQSQQSSIMHAPAPLRADAFMLSEYEITEEPLENRHIKRLPAQVQARVDDLYELAQHNPTHVIPELEQLIARYPQVPTFFNYLSIAYLAAGDQENATACVRDAYRRHPQYLFAKVNYANLCLQQREIEKIPSIFDQQFDLKQLYPQRTRFHVSEFTGFAGVMCRYFCAIGARDTAALYYRMLTHVAPHHPMTQHAKRVLYPPFWVRWLRTWAAKWLPEYADPGGSRRHP